MEKYESQKLTSFYYNFISLSCYCGNFEEFYINHKYLLVLGENIKKKNHMMKYPVYTFSEHKGLALEYKIILITKYTFYQVSDIRFYIHTGIRI